MVYKCTSPKLLAEKVGFLLSDEWMCLLHRSLFFYKFEKEWGVSRGSAMWTLCAPLFFPSLPLWLGTPRTRGGVSWLPPTSPPQTLQCFC